MSKRLLFIEDLYEFYSNNYKRSTHFDANKSGSPIVVQVHGKVNFDKSNKDTEGLLPVHLQACHTNLNINGSNIDEAVMTSALPSFSNRPILGYIHTVNGQDEFYSHNMHEDEDGNIVYDEAPIGIIPESCNAHLVYDEEKGKTYCEVDGYIYEEYSKAAEILQREGECSVSVELSIRELSYNAKEKYLNIEDFWFSGVTILGKTPDGETVMPGMEKSNIKLADFSEKNNSLFAKYENQLIEFQARLEKLESACINKENFEEGGNETNMNKFEELLAKYGKTVEDITFDYAELSDEELEAKFEELFGENVDETDDVDTSNEDGSGDEPSDNDEGDDTADTNDGAEEEPTEESTEEQDEQFEKIVRTYEISHDDIRYALYNLLSAYESADNEWYFISAVYDSHFVYENWTGEKIYGQAYTKDGDNVDFDGDRYNLHRELLTDSEYAELCSMRSNYSSIMAELNTYKSAEAYADKMSVFEDDAYTDYLETEEFKALMSDEIINQYSKEELVEKADATLGKLVKKNKTFSYTEKQNKTNKINFAIKDTSDEEKKAYGTLFD